MKTIFFFSSFLFLFNKGKKIYKIVSHFSYFFNAGNVNDEIIFFVFFSFLKISRVSFNCIGLYDMQISHVGINRLTILFSFFLRKGLRIALLLLLNVSSVS